MKQYKNRAYPTQTKKKKNGNAPAGVEGEEGEQRVGGAGAGGGAEAQDDVGAEEGAVGVAVSLYSLVWFGVWMGWVWGQTPFTLPHTHTSHIEAGYTHAHAQATHPLALPLLSLGLFRVREEAGVRGGLERGGQQEGGEEEAGLCAYMWGWECVRHDMDRPCASLCLSSPIHLHAIHTYIHIVYLAPKPLPVRPGEPPRLGEHRQAEQGACVRARVCVCVWSGMEW